MADIDKIEKRLTKLESRFNNLITAADRLHESIGRVVGKIEKRVTANVKGQNKVNTKIYKHITALEKRFTKIDKHTKKMKKQVDPRQMERDTMKLVDQALKAYDKQKGRK